MSHRGKCSITFRLFVLYAALASQAGWAGLAVPCRSSTQKTGSLEDCSVAKARLAKEIEEAVKDNVDKKYNGVDEGSFGVQSLPFVTPVCSVVANSLTGGQKEIESNHLGKSCGLAAEVRRRKVGRRRYVVWTQGGGGRGYWEGAIDRGAWVHAVACALKSAKKDLTEKSSVDLPVPQVMVDDYDRGLNFAQVTSSPEAVAKCQYQKTERAQVEEINQLNCQASALREQVQAHFKELALFGIYSQADQRYHAFLNKLYEKPDRAIIKSNFQHMIHDTCKGAGNAQGCYQKKYRELIEGLIESEITSKGCG
jgi:hypothetical protein